MKSCGRWLATSQIRIAELCAAAILLVATTLADTFDTVAFGAFLLFLMLYSYLRQDGSGR